MNWPWGLLLDFKSFTSFSYKISLIKCLIDRSFKVCNKWNSFHNEIEKIKSNLIKNAYPTFLIYEVIKKYIDYKFSCNQNHLKEKSGVQYFKLPYIGKLYTISKISFRNFAMTSFIKKIKSKISIAPISCKPSKPTKSSKLS